MFNYKVTFIPAFLSTSTSFKKMARFYNRLQKSNTIINDYQLIQDILEKHSKSADLHKVACVHLYFHPVLYHSIQILLGSGSNLGIYSTLLGSILYFFGDSSWR